MMRAGALTALLWGAGLAASCGAQTSVWDPTEIARMGEQAAQIALDLSALAQLQQQLSGVAAALGTGGPRGSPVADAGDPPWLPPEPAASIPPSPADAGATATTAWRQARQAAATQTSAEAMALALANLRDLQAAGDRAVALRAAVAASGDLRADLQANSAVALAILSETTAIAVLLTLTLQLHCLPRAAHP